MSTVLLAGGSGLIGNRLSTLLEKEGYDVIFLSRKIKSDKRFFLWDVSKGTIDSIAIEKADYVINLAGAGIVDKRWTDKRKKILIEMSQILLVPVTVPAGPYITSNTLLVIS